MLRLLCFIAVLAAVAGCQTPCTIYTNGLIFWCSTSAVGIGWGEYIEVAAGGKLDRASTNDAPALISEGNVRAASDIKIDNTATNRVEEDK
jgi:hypothetical protein